MALPTPTKVFGICIDGPLRDISPVFQERYANRFGQGDTSQLQEVTATHEIVGVDGSVSKETYTYTPEHQPTQRDFSGEAIRPVPSLETLDPFTLLEKFEFKDQAEIDDFVQGESFFLFSRAPKTEEGLRTWLNQLYLGLRKAGYKVVFISSDIPKTRPATLFFVADLGADVDEVRFVSTIDQYWAGVDVLLTANPRVLAARPEGKQGVLRLTHYNNPDNLSPTPYMDLQEQEARAVAAVTEGMDEDTKVKSIFNLASEVIDAHKTKKPFVNKLAADVTRISAVRELLHYFPV